MDGIMFFFSSLLFYIHGVLMGNLLFVFRMYSIRLSEQLNSWCLGGGGRLHSNVNEGK